MNIGVTIHARQTLNGAGSIGRILIVSRRRRAQSLAGGVLGGVDRRGNTGNVSQMAGRQAQKRGPHLEHRIGRRPMGIVAKIAVLGDRLVAPDERAPLFCVAHVARGVDRVLDQQLLSERAMRIVAIRTSHLAFWNGVMRRFIGESALILVTPVTDLGLRVFVEDIVVARVNFMT